MAKKGQTFTRYSEETKREAVRLRLEKGWSFPMIQERLGIKKNTSILEWVRKFQAGESFEHYRGRWINKPGSGSSKE